MKYLQTRGNYD